jgi:nuclear GTP-binding protein
MAIGKKEKSRLQREGKVTGDPKVKGENFYRSAKKIKTLNMYKEGKAIRNKEGKIVKAASYQSRDVPKAVIEPNRRWFTNTRVISQDTLKSFREAIAEKEKDPYSVLLKSNKLPMSLIRDTPNLQDGLKKHQAKMTIESEPFSETFGPKAQRKRPKLSFNTVDELAGHTEESLNSYQSRLEEIRLLNGTAGAAAVDGDTPVEEEDFSVATAKEAIFSKGQSKRIWNELCGSRLAAVLRMHLLTAT